jgi:CRISPR/Cas system-associated exonuclease Cas4 (RecB family)
MTSLSYTYLRTYRSCHRRAYLQYVKKVIAPEDIDQRPFIVGICVDWLFRKWATERDFTAGWMAAKAEEMFEWFAAKRRIKYKDGSDKVNLIDKTIRAASKLEEIAFAEHLPMRNFETQKEIRLVRGDFTFTGKLDMWFPEERAIWDLKVTKDKKYLDNFQLYYFAWILEEKLQLSITDLRFLSPLMYPAVIEVGWSPVEKHETEETVTTLRFSVENKDWRPTSKDCWNCPVAKWCEEPEQVKKTRNDKGGFILDLSGGGGLL